MTDQEVPAAPPERASRAEIIAIGSELLSPLRQDTNSLWLTARLEEVGIVVARKAIVSDEIADIIAELEMASRTAALIVTTGGLGPTADDRTVEALARWLGVSLVRNAEFLGKIRTRFERRGIHMPEVNAKQADFPVGARVLENPRGTAPGFWGRRGDTEVVVLPGVPSEMREIMEETVLPELARRAGGAVARRRILRIAGIGESAVEELVAPVYAHWPENPVTILASPGEVELHLVTRGDPAAAEERLRAMEADFRAALGTRVYGEDSAGLSHAVGDLLRRRARRLALAESCTGGMVAALVTDVAGSSDYFLGGAVTYADSAKQALLDVSPETIARHGAVSEESAREMARGALARFGADVALSLTGIAGPGGGSEAKPVGTVHIAIAGPEGRELAKKRLFVGDRDLIRRTASRHALELLRRHLLAAEPA
jgi:nicotinamide-nucleotide amidase